MKHKPDWRIEYPDERPASRGKFRCRICGAPPSYQAVVEQHSMHVTVPRTALWRLRERWIEEKRLAAIQAKAKGPRVKKGVVS